MKYKTNQVKKQRSALVLLEVSSERKARLASMQYMRTSKPSPSGHIRTGWDQTLHLKGLARRKGEEGVCPAGSQSGKPLYLLWGRLNKGQSGP